jgi:hypothetical protein
MFAATVCGLGVSVLFFSDRTGADVITFKKGGRQRCVIVKETEDKVHFISRVGTCETPRARIEKIQYESDEKNAALKEKWTQRKEQATAEQSRREPKNPQAAGEQKDTRKPKPHRTYTVEPTKFAISIGGRATGIRSAQRTATFVIDDLGMVEGNRVFHVAVTSYRSGGRTISMEDFHALTSRGMRVDPRPLKGYPILRASLQFKKTVSGHVAFPTEDELKWLFVQSDIAEFKLDLASGEFESQRGPF